MSRLPELDAFTGYLPPGIHPADHYAIRQSLVEARDFLILFDRPRRAELFSGYERLISAFELIGLPTEQWIGGSFVSKAEEPDDIDVVHYCDAHAWQKLPAEIKAMIKLYIDGERTAKLCHCDSYFVPTPPKEHQLSNEFQTIINYWKKKLGHDDIGRPKGIISRLIESDQRTIDSAAIEHTDDATT